jgi:hypothetical protein
LIISAALVDNGDNEGALDDSQHWIFSIYHMMAVVVMVAVALAVAVAVAVAAATRGWQ